MEKKIIGRIENLSFSYNDIDKALDGLSFDIYEGEYLSIIGHNGSGKSTLAKVLVGLITKYDGSAEIFDLKICNQNLAEIRQKVGIVFQNPDNQFVGSTVEDDIAFGLENRKVPSEEMKPIIDEFATTVGMQDFLDKEPENLSGGQKQRIAIAGVLAMKPSLVIFDEATSMLDPKGRIEISNLIAKLKKENPSLTLISITHDLEEANNSDRVIVLDKGKLTLQGTPYEVFSHNEYLESVNLNTPFFYQLKSTLINEGFKIPEDIKDIESLEDFICK